MSSECPECKDSILNNQTSKIGQPICADSCPEDTDCEGIITSSDCITVNAALDCTDTSVGDTLTDVLEDIDTKLCQAIEGTNTIQITALDTCYGFLFSKVTSDSLALSVVNPGACEKLKIEEKCRTWTDVNPAGVGDGRFLNDWINLDATGTIIQKAQYSNVKECSVRLRGGITNTNSWAGNGTLVIFTLPTGKRPLTIRWFHASVDVSGDLYLASIRVLPSGDVTISADLFASPGVPTTSLDNIEFEID